MFFINALRNLYVYEIFFFFFLKQYYFYEFAEEGDDLHVKRPRHCLPYAVITISVGDSLGPHQESSIVQVRWKQNVMFVTFFLYHTISDFMHFC